MSNTNILRRGDRLEYLAMGVFQGQGYLVRRKVPLKYGLGGQDATDVDVLGIKFTKPFQPQCIICDCKERQRTKPYERIFWAKGLSSFVNALEVYVALPKASWEIINFARLGQVHILTYEVLQDSFVKTYGKDGKAYGLANQFFYEPLYQRMLQVCKKHKKVGDILFQARTLYLVTNPYVSLNIALPHLKASANMLRRVENISRDIFELWRFITADLIVAISLMLLYIASDTIGFSKTERQRHIIERLTYGDVSPKKAREIFSLAKELALEWAKTLSPGTSHQSFLPLDIGDIEPPSYAPNVAGLVERAIASPSLYHELPQLLDFLLFEQSLQNKAFSDDEYRHTFPSTMQDERLKVARNIFAFVRDAVGLDLKVFWPKEENNLPKKKLS